MAWKYNKHGKYWMKQLHHWRSNITDGWGISSDEKFNYHIETYAYKCFSFKRGIWYQIQVPNLTVNEKALGNALDLLFRYLYADGGTPCYQRLEDELMRRGLWKKLGS